MENCTNDDVNLTNAEYTDEETDKSKELSDANDSQISPESYVRNRKIHIDSNNTGDTDNSGCDDTKFKNKQVVNNGKNSVLPNNLKKEGNKPNNLKKEGNKPNNNLCSKLFASFLILFTVFSIYMCSSKNEFIEHTTIETILKKFPLQPLENLETIEAVIDDVLKYEPIHPAVFLFIFDEKTENNEFISAIANFASSKLKVSKNHIILNEAIYSKPEVKKDYGYLISEYKPELESKKVMIIKNLHKMPGTTAQALHSFCDEITPLVDRAVYILTLKVDSYSGNEMHTAEKRLYEVWGDLKNDILAPLVTRVTSTVIKMY